MGCRKLRLNPNVRYDMLKIPVHLSGVDTEMVSRLADNSRLGCFPKSKWSDGVCTVLPTKDRSKKCHRTHHGNYARKIIEIKYDAEYHFFFHMVENSQLVN